jgi:hypothetical protein
VGPVAAVPATTATTTPVPPAGTSSPGGAHEQRGPDVVHVSIGRVEVRATLPPPAPAAAPGRARVAAPTLSLHDYLSGKREST